MAEVAGSVLRVRCWWNKSGCWSSLFLVIWTELKNRTWHSGVEDEQTARQTVVSQATPRRVPLLPRHASSPDAAGAEEANSLKWADDGGTETGSHRIALLAAAAAALWAGAPAGRRRGRTSIRPSISTPPNRRLAQSVRRARNVGVSDSRGEKAGRFAGRWTWRDACAPVHQVSVRAGLRAACLTTLKKRRADRAMLVIQRRGKKKPRSGSVR